MLNFFRKFVGSPERTINFTKVDCCGMCFDEVRDWILPQKELDKPERQPILRIQIAYQQINLCERHAKEFYDELGKFMLSHKQLKEISKNYSNVQKEGNKQ